MERLTNAKEAAAQRRAYEKRLEQGYPRNIPEERFLKLAAYEDTGLEPGEIGKIREDIESGYLKSIDAVPVVRCRECHHYEPCEGGKDFCCLHRIGVVKDDFCSYGERKGGNSNG